MSSPFKNIVRQVRLCVRSEEVRLEIDEELQFHLEMRAQDNLESGMTPEDARSTALKQFGDYETIKQDCYAVSGGRSPKIMGVRAAVSLALVFSGLTLAVWAVNQPQSGRQLLCAVLALLIGFTSFIMLPGSVRQLPSERRQSILGLADAGTPVRVPVSHEPALHQGEGWKSPVERMLEDR